MGSYDAEMGIYGQGDCRDITFLFRKLHVESHSCLKTSLLHANAIRVSTKILVNITEHNLPVSLVVDSTWIVKNIRAKVSQSELCLIYVWYE